MNTVYYYYYYYYYYSSKTHCQNGWPEEVIAQRH